MLSRSAVTVPPRNSPRSPSARHVALNTDQEEEEKELGDDTKGAEDKWREEG